MFIRELLEDEIEDALRANQAERVKLARAAVRARQKRGPIWERIAALRLEYEALADALLAHGRGAQS